MPKETFFNLTEEKQSRIIEAAVNNFSEEPYDQVKLSNIIKEAKIPRGSFYQYFEDKFDLYKYLFDKIAERKLEYMQDLLPNNDSMSFLDLFYQLYLRGTKFAYENPRYVKISAHLFKYKGTAYEVLVKDNLDIARNYYIGYIEEDKKRGRIDPNVDSMTLSNIVIDMTTNVAIENLGDGTNVDYDKMISRIEQIIYIFKKGIQSGE